MPEAVATDPQVAEPTQAQPAANLELEGQDAPLVPADTGTPAPAKDGATAPTGEPKPPEGQKPAEKKADEPAAPPAGYRPDAEFRRLQSVYDRRIADTEARLRDMESRQSETAIEAQIEGYRRNMREWFTQQGVDPAQAANQIEQQANLARNALIGQREREATEQQLEQARISQVGAIMSSWEHELARTEGLDEGDLQILRGYYDPASIRDEQSFLRVGRTLGALARRLGAAAKATTAATKAKEAAVPPQRFEGGEGTGAMTDDQFLRAYAEGKINDHQRARAIQERQGVF